MSLAVGPVDPDDLLALADDPTSVDHAVLLAELREGGQLLPDFLLVPAVVVVEHADELAVSHRGRPVHAMGDTAVLVVVADAYPIVVGVGIELRRRVVGRAVVHDDDLDLVMSLVEDRFDGSGDVLRAVVRRQDGADERHCPLSVHRP